MMEKETIMNIIGFLAVAAFSILAISGMITVLSSFLVKFEL